MSAGKGSSLRPCRKLNDKERLFWCHDVLRRFRVSDNEHLSPALWTLANHQSGELLLVSICEDRTVSGSCADRPCGTALQRQSLFQAEHRRLLGSWCGNSRINLSIQRPIGSFWMEY